tara:strand:- start:4028 stop:5203 length:1176 start_codon:yes stop_codon:yes gene_type:complete
MAKKKITIVGAGYVGMSLAVLLARSNSVTILDIDSQRIEKIKSGKSTISDADIENHLKENNLNLNATLNTHEAIENAKFVIIATPTDYDSKKKKFNTNSVDSIVRKALDINSDCLIVIKSTIPIGHSSYLQKKHKTKRIIYSPEFLREGNALHDGLFPSRIVVGKESKLSEEFGKLLLEASKQKNAKTLLVSSTEAESIKLFANAYLAMRVSFFNELDSFALSKNLDAKKIIQGVSLDKRIGDGYNNPSFGYGGYCLPKDTKQLLSSFNNIPQSLIKAIVESNSLRKDLISDEILNLNPKVVGFYRLVMKAGSDNFKSSSIQGIIKRVKARGIKTLIYEPLLGEKIFFGTKVIKDLDQFKELSDLIVVNRKESFLEDVQHKCYSRDIFSEN